MSPTRRDTGAAAVELALVLPILMLLIGGIVDFGRAMYTQIQLTNAAREGARTAIISSSSSTDIRSRTAAAASTLAVTTALVVCAGPGTEAKVTATSDFRWIVLGPALRMVGATKTLPTSLHSTAVMRCG